MKYTSILILALVATSVLAVDENCKDHPWAKKDLFKKFKTQVYEDLTPE